jgi:exodeoxyribonuclease VII large subunit
MVVRDSRDRLRHAARDLAGVGEAHMSSRRTSLQEIAGRLNTLSPLSTLARGYSVARDASGGTLNTANAFAEGMPFDLVVSDGVVPARVDGMPRSSSNSTSNSTSTSTPRSE